MRPSHSQIAAALEHFGLGPVNDRQFAMIAVTVESITETTLTVKPHRRKLPLELMRSQVTAVYYTAERAVIKMPRRMIVALDLEHIALSGRRLDYFMKRVAEHNALRPTSSRKPESVAGIRI